VTLGLPLRPWDRVEKVQGQEMFTYFDVEHFVPSQWKNEYSNPSFSRMTERDAAWMARILSRFTREDVRAIAGMAAFTEPANTEYLGEVLEGRLEKILSRYLTRLSPLGDVHLEGGDNLCATDFALRRQVRDPASFRFEAAVGQTPVPVRLRDASVCLALPHVAADGGSPDGDPSRYIDVTVTDGVARGPLVAHLYDLGPARGFVLAGLDRPLP
jgi:hypothetical protein